MMVLREAGTRYVLGVAVGVLAAIGITRSLRMLFGLTPTDPLAISSQAGEQLAVAASAALILPAVHRGLIRSRIREE